LPCLLEPRDLLLNAFGSPVRELTVELMLAARNGKRRLGGEVGIDELVDELGPLDVHGRRGRLALVLRRRRLAAAGEHCECRCNDC
jgi:hypothetical protein